MQSASDGSKQQEIAGAHWSGDDFILRLNRVHDLSGRGIGNEDREPSVRVESPILRRRRVEPAAACAPELSARFGINRDELEPSAPDIHIERAQALLSDDKQRSSVCREEPANWFQERVRRFGLWPAGRPAPYVRAEAKPCSRPERCQPEALVSPFASGKTEPVECSIRGMHGIDVPIDVDSNLRANRLGRFLWHNRPS